MMNTLAIRTEKYASCVDASKRVRWDIDRDVIRGRDFGMDQKLLPDSISGIQRFEFLDPEEVRLLSQIQGRTYANMFGLVERFINCKVLELSQHHWTGDQVALEALVRFSDEELKHQELFRRSERTPRDVRSVTAHPAFIGLNVQQPLERGPRHSIHFIVEATRTLVHAGTALHVPFPFRWIQRHVP